MGEATAGPDHLRASTQAGPARRHRAPAQTCARAGPARRHRACPLAGRAGAQAPRACPLAGRAGAQAPPGGADVPARRPSLRAGRDPRRIRTGRPPPARGVSAPARPARDSAARSETQSTPSESAARPERANARWSARASAPGTRAPGAARAGVGRTRRPGAYGPGRAGSRVGHAAALAHARADAARVPLPPQVPA